MPDLRVSSYPVLMRFSAMSVLPLVLLASCMPSSRETPSVSPPDVLAPYRAALAELPPEILERAQAAPDRFVRLTESVRAEETDPWLLVRVDKEKALPADYVPEDLVPLTEYPFALSRKDLSLRKLAAEAARRMDAAAKADGVTLVFSSTYRSYAYQEQVYARNVRQMGQTEADRVSARPGHSQHQLGTVVDFGSIDDSFADTTAGRWMAENAGRFGFSLSFPKGAEGITGYSWESWHFRYVGTDAVTLEKEFFGGIQQYLMEFLERLRSSGSAGGA